MPKNAPSNPLSVEGVEGGGLNFAGIRGGLTSAGLQPFSAIPDSATYITGGSTGTVQADVTFHDTSDSSISAETDLQQTVYFHAAERLGDYIYIFGGLTGSGKTDKIQRYDIVNDTTKVQTETLQNSVRNINAHRYNDKLYLLGATTGSGPNADIRTYTAGSQPSTVNSFAQGITAVGSGVTDNGYIAAFGGYYGGSTFQNNIYRYDIANDTTDQPNSITTASRNGDAVGIGDKIYHFGGQDSNTNRLSTVWEYDPANNNISTVANLNTGVTQPAVTAINGKAYIYGGLDSNGQTDIIQTFDPSNNSTSTLTETLPQAVSAPAAPVL